MSRSNARSRRLRHRPSRTIPASIVAVVLLIVGLLATVAAIARLTNGTWPSQVASAASSLADLTWGSAVVVIGGAVLALLGLVLLIAALKPGPLKTAVLVARHEDSAAEETDFVISTRAMAHLAAGRADRVDGVDKVSASASGRRVKVKVATTSEQTDRIRERVQRDVTETLSAAGVQPVPRVSTTVRTKGI